MAGEGKGSPNGLSLSEVVGWATTGIAMVSRTPQVMKVLKSRSVDGLDPTLFEMDTICNTVTAFYHIIHKYPINTYGETIAFCVQNIATIYLMSKFGVTAAAKRRAKLFMVSYGLACAYIGLHLKQCRRNIELAQKVSYGGLQLSRFPQIMLNFRSKSTGQLSMVSYVLNVIGSTARLFTTVKQLGGNRSLMMGFGSSIFINSVLALQILYYGGGSKASALKG